MPLWLHLWQLPPTLLQWHRSPCFCLRIQTCVCLRAFALSSVPTLHPFLLHSELCLNVAFPEGLPNYPVSLCLSYFLRMSQLSLLSQNTIDFGAETTDVYFSQLGRFENPRSKGTGRFGVWWEPSSWFAEGHCLAVPAPGGGRESRGAPLCLFLKGH